MSKIDDKNNIDSGLIAWITALATITAVVAIGGACWLYRWVLA